MAEEPNIILIVCDTLRRDVLKVYGGEAKTPAIDKLAKDSVVYPDAIAPSPWTFPSHVSLFTGLYPSEHGIHEDVVLKPFDLIARHGQLKTIRMAEYLKKVGYTTTGISNNAWVSSLTGFEKGFHNFFALDTLPRWITEKLNKAQEYGPDTMTILSRLIGEGKFSTILEYREVLKTMKRVNHAHNFPMDKGVGMTMNILLNENWDSKFFKFLNFVEPHEPYVGENERERWDHIINGGEMNPNTVAKLRAEYVREVEYLDQQLMALIDMLKDRGIYDDTIIILASDHGQAFNEHGFMYHGSYLYDEIVEIPLIVKYQKGKKFKIKSGYQSLVNLLPMIKSVIEGGDDKMLYSDAAFSESFGFSHALPVRYKNRGSEINKELTKTRKCVYKKGYKLTYNLTDKMVEEFLYDGKNADKKKYKIMIEELKEDIIRFNSR